MQKRLTDAEDTSARLIIRMIFEPSGVLAEQSPSQCPEYLHQLEHSLVSALIRQGIQPPRARNLAALTGTFLIGLFGILVFVGQKPFENKYLASLPVLEQLLKEEKHYTALIGGAASLLCLLLFGPDSFLIPTMVCVLGLLTLLRRPIEPTLKGGDAA